jgi:hypothetical protein
MIPRFTDVMKDEWIFNVDGVDYHCRQGAFRLKEVKTVTGRFQMCATREQVLEHCKVITK